MTKLTQAQQAKADRKAEALARRADRAAGVETVVEQNVRLYSNTSAPTTKPAKKEASILRRLSGRINNLRELGGNYNDTHLFLLQSLAAHFSPDQLSGMMSGQNSIIKKFDRLIEKTFNIGMTMVEGLQDDQESNGGKPFVAWFVDAEDVAMVKEFINTEVAKYAATYTK